MVKVFGSEVMTIESPTEFADFIGVEYAKTSGQLEKKERGQFFTPVTISKFMGRLYVGNKSHFDVLDPGFGTGILTCSLIEAQIESNANLKTVSITAYENDQYILPYAEQVLKKLKVWAANKGVDFKYELIFGDFISLSYKYLLNPAEKYDVIITNPPYYKLGKEEVSVQLCKELVSGQPNIYSFFLGIASSLLREEGNIISITPRSFSSGRYFQAFRDFFFSRVRISHVHLFDSRRSSFNRDKVLQEVLIMKVTKINSILNGEIQISCSGGLDDLHKSMVKTYDISMIMDTASAQKVLHIPVSDNEEKVLKLVLGWNNKLADLNINISTGPVVSFRAKKFLSHESVGTCPLIRLHNVTKMELKYPLKMKDKTDRIIISKASMSILLPNKDYVLLRRFSTKDDKSRLIAAPFFATDVSQENYVGIDNAVNYIYRKNGTLDCAEVIGLSALLNSDLFDTYFRIFNGNVNVSATELREMRFPDLETIKSIGDELTLCEDISLSQINYIINNKFYQNNTSKNNFNERSIEC